MCTNLYSTTGDSMFNHSRWALLNYLNESNKRFIYKFGLDYNIPSVYETPISKEVALEIVVSSKLMEITERDGIIKINIYDK